MKKLIFLCFLFLVFGCSGNIKQVNMGLGDWKYSDLRAVDPSDFPYPSQDIVAVYSREQGDELQIRIDFLYQVSDDPLNLMIMFDNGTGENHSLLYGIAGASNWNYLLWIPTDGHAILYNQKWETVNSPRLSIYRDPNLDAAIININKSSIENLSIKTHIELVSINFTPANIESDTLGPIKLYSSPPPPGSVMIAFWNTFYSDTPAQALRSWDGAHTGPFSSRHGLKPLINAAEATGVPVFLTDLNKPKNMSVLDYLGVQQQIQKLTDQGEIILTNPDDSFSLNLIQSYEETTNELDNASSEDVPSVSTRKKLVENSVNPGKTLLLGGDFARSRWGNYDYTIQMLTYIKNHPWIKPIIDQSLRNTSITPVDEVSGPLISAIRTELSSSTKNQIRQVAEQLLSTLITSETPIVDEIHHQFIEQIGHLTAIAKWSKDRQAVTDCKMDLDWDNQPECILTSETLAAVIDMQGGYITFSFAFHEGKFHQIIGPSFQLVTGLSDVVTWNLFKTTNKDQSIIPGAFADANWNWQKFIPILIEPGKIILQDENNQLQKIFTMTDDSIQFSYKGLDTDSLLIPLIVDPWTMEVSDWGSRYQNKITPGSLEWGILQEIFVSVYTSNPVEFYSFKDSTDVIRSPEDPSYDYPLGHFLPFPLAVEVIKTSGEGTVSINLTY